MKVSEITITEICQQIREMEVDLDECDKRYLTALQTAAVSYVKEYTGLSEKQIDEYQDITLAVLVLISDMYDNRQMYVDKGNVNRVVDTILGMHCINLLPSAEGA